MYLVLSHFLSEKKEDVKTILQKSPLFSSDNRPQDGNKRRLLAVDRRPPSWPRGIPPPALSHRSSRPDTCLSGQILRKGELRLA